MFKDNCSCNNTAPVAPVLSPDDATIKQIQASRDRKSLSDPVYIRFNMVMNSETKVVLQSLNWMVDALQLLAWSAEDRYCVHHASLEAINNAIEHGNKYKKTKKIYFSGSLSSERVILRFRDEGKGFDLSRVMDPTTQNRITRPRGRGLFLMQKFMTAVRYNFAKKELTLTKKPTRAK
ncbi:MAG: ATP-binding protein [Planctomycetia bacterium]|nr:ATP-binding protein [Planctomycetia bacterium]